MGWLARLFGQGKPRAFADLLVERLEGDPRVESVRRNDAQDAIDVKLRSGASVGINLD